MSTKFTEQVDLPAGASAWRNGRVDRSGWESGPWDGEPDKVSWTDARTGRPCLIVRNPSGALCGYAAVDPGHSLHGVDYMAAPDAVHDAAHGGLTFASLCAETTDEGEGICHVPEPGAPENVWWFGFDCAHGGDLAPGHHYWSTRHGYGHLHASDVYRRLAYVRGRVEALALALTQSEDGDSAD